MNNCLNHKRTLESLELISSGLSYFLLDLKIQKS
jgi:hypothetical protein